MESGNGSNGNILATMLTEATVLKLDISIPSMTTRLKPEDIGIDPEEVNSDLFSLGSKRLMPKEEINKLNSIRQKAFSHLETFSFDFSFGRFVPKEKLDVLESKLTELKAQFDSIVKDIHSRYDEIKHEMMVQWEEQAVTICNRRGLPKEDVFKILERIENAFQKSDKKVSKFSFGWRKYNDINDIAKDFIEANVQDIVDKMVEFAEKLRSRIHSESLTEKNLKPVRKYIDAMYDSVKVFRSDKLTSLFDSMDAMVVEEMDIDVKSNVDIKTKMLSAMDNIIDSADDLVTEISKDSIEKITSYGRKLDLS